MGCSTFSLNISSIYIRIKYFVVILCGLLWSWTVCCFHLKLMRSGASVLCIYLLPLMNSCNKTETAIFSINTMLPEDFLYFSFLVNEIIKTASLRLKFLHRKKSFFNITYKETSCFMSYSMSSWLCMLFLVP